MTVCDLCVGKNVAQTRELVAIPSTEERTVDMCEEHWKMYQEAVGYFNCLWTSNHTFVRSDTQWAADRNRLLPVLATTQDGSH